MKTRGELETELAHLVIRLHKDLFGRGPADVRAHLLDDLALAHATGVLTLLEVQLARANAANPDGLLRAVRDRLLAAALPTLCQDVSNLLGVPVRTALTDLCPATDQAVYVFPLSAPPRCRDA